MEVSSNVTGSGILHTRLETGVVRGLVHEVLREKGTASRTGLGSPESTTSAIPITMTVPNIIATSGHMVDNSIGINTNTSSTACLDHVTQFVSGSHSRVKFIGNRLINKEPGIQLAILRPLIRHEGFIWWEHLDSHVTSLGKERTLFLDVSVRPSKEFYDSTFLSILVVIRLIDGIGLPDKVGGLHSYLKVLTFRGDLNLEGSGIGDRRVSFEAALCLITLTIPIVLDVGHRIVLAALGLHSSRLSILSVGHLVIAHDATKTFIRILVKSGIWTILQEGLECSF